LQGPDSYRGSPLLFKAPPKAFGEGFGTQERKDKPLFAAWGFWDMLVLMRLPDIARLVVKSILDGMITCRAELALISNFSSICAIERKGISYDKSLKSHHYYFSVYSLYLLNK
jgi:hypothetical protein